MQESLWCRLFVLVFYWANISTGSQGTTPKYVCLEDSVQLFQNLPLASDGPAILYRHGFRDTIIAKWKIKASLLNYSSGLECKEKVSLDECGTVWMRNVQRSDEGKYLLRYGADNSSLKLEAHIIVMVVPPLQCKPKIVQIHNILTASLNDKDCGETESSVNWLDDPGISSIDATAVKLHSEEKAGTYYACIKSQAITCAKNSKQSDYCSSFTIAGNNAMDKCMQSSINAVTITILVAVLVLTVVAVVFVSRYTLRRYKKNHTCQDSRKELNGKYPQLWRKHFDNLKWENIFQLLNGDQQQDLQKYCEELNRKYPKLRRKKFDAKAEKIIDSDGRKMRQQLWNTKRKGDVYTEFYKEKPMDPNVWE